MSSISRAWGKLPTSAEKFPVNLGVGGKLILKEALSRDVLAHFPQVVPVVLTVQNCGDSPPTHSFTLLLVHIFRREFPSHPKANEILVSPSAWQHHCSFGREEKLLIILHFPHTLTRRNHTYLRGSRCGFERACGTNTRLSGDPCFKHARHKMLNLERNKAGISVRGRAEMIF